MFDRLVIQGGIPAGLDEMEPGPVLAGWLSAIDVAELSGRDRLEVLRAHQRMASHYAAEIYRDMAAVTDAVADELGDNGYQAPEFAAAEIRAALTLTRRTADAELGHALDLHRRLPRAFDALRSGSIDAPRAKVIVTGTAHLSTASARRVADRVLDEAEGLTTGQLRALIRRLSMEDDPADARDRFENAVAQRRVVTAPTPEGTCHLHGMDLPPERVSAAMQRINRMARDLRVSGETRSMDQIRADVLLDLLEGAGTASGSRRGTVDIHVDLATLAEMNEDPADLAGYGPVIADIARQVAKDQRGSEWRFTVTDPETALIVGTGITRRRPTTGQRRHVQVRYRTCIFPGCRMPAAAADLDHRVPYSEGGPTDTKNLAPLCRHDHRIKHEAGWSYERLANGDHEWTSKLGRTYVTRPRPP